MVPLALLALAASVSAADFGALAPLEPLRLAAGLTPPATAVPEINSKLDFAGVTWPASLTPQDRVAFALALNISGSFEGEQAWATISNDFDGQGLSLGLLNQCLGQGSLQPMLQRMRENHPETMAVVFSSDHLKSLYGMLDAWQRAARAEVSEGTPKRLDWRDEPPVGTLDRTGPSADEDSVAWAERTLYTDGGVTFDPVWKAELTALAAHPQYVSYQLDAALRYHDKAAGYEAVIKVRELRAYLMLYDIVVQNGGLYQDDLDDYAAYVKANPKSTATQRLRKLLALRLRHVRPKYVADVRSRKNAIISGTGTVHGSRRNLPVEYNYPPEWPYR
jgi:hypothetical protein